MELATPSLVTPGPSSGTTGKKKTKEEDHDSPKNQSSNKIEKKKNTDGSSHASTLKTPASKSSGNRKATEDHDPPKNQSSNKIEKKKNTDGSSHASTSKTPASKSSGKRKATEEHDSPKKKKANDSDAIELQGASSFMRDIDLFYGAGQNEVCEVCCQTSSQSSDIFRCQGPCKLWIHYTCSNSSRYIRPIPSDGEASKHAPILPPPPSEPEDDGEGDINFNYKDNKKGKKRVKGRKDKIKGPICGLCNAEKSRPCFICGKEDGELHRCRAADCGKEYHLSCAQVWPQSIIDTPAEREPILLCPQHACHTCISNNPSSTTAKFNPTLVKCVQCPAAYHHGNHCLPAGSQVLTNSQIICHRHCERKKNAIINASWCVLCCMGGALICCELCPNSYHLNCLNLESSPDGHFICRSCSSGRFPVYGDIVWAKFKTSKWWPGRIIYPQEIPVNVMRQKNDVFAIKFYGNKMNCYGWINRGRVFLLSEGNDGTTAFTLQGQSSYFVLALNQSREALRDFIKYKNSMGDSSVPPKYVEITQNIFTGNTRIMNRSIRTSITACVCNRNFEKPCSQDCLNRSVRVECNPHICSSGKEDCSNRQFQKGKSPKLKCFQTEFKGWGLKTLEPIKQDSFIVEYIGEVIDDFEYRLRLENMKREKHENQYFLELDRGIVIDSRWSGNLSRFMNHSCSPNCRMEKWSVNGQTRVGFFAEENIEASSELTFDYNDESLTVCKCGSSNCTGFIGKNTSNPSTSKQGKTQKSSGNLKKHVVNKRKTKQKQHLLEKNYNYEGFCFICRKNDTSLVRCYVEPCVKGYHYSCLGLTENPPGMWVCPRHVCSVCSRREIIEYCSICTNSYCSEHTADNISHNQTQGSVCLSHGSVLKKISPSDEELLFREQEFPDMNIINPDSLQCTCCGASVKDLFTEGHIISHPLLDTLICLECKNFYLSGEFKFDEDGLDMYCRWCGQGGSLYICTKCPHGFCKSCLDRNVSQSARKDVDKDDWECYVCNIQPLYRLRAVCSVAKRLALEQQEPSCSSAYNAACEMQPEVISNLGHDEMIAEIKRVGAETIYNFKDAALLHATTVQTRKSAFKSMETFLSLLECHAVKLGNAK